MISASSFNLASTGQNPLQSGQSKPASRGISIYSENVTRVPIENTPLKDLSNQLNGPAQQRVQQHFEQHSETAIENYRAQLLEQGGRRDTEAIFRLNGNIIASLSSSGSGEMTNSVAQVLRNTPSNVDSIEKTLEEKYGNNLKVEKFSAGQGPTQTELFEMRHGRSLNSYINETTTQMRTTANAQQYQLQQDRLEQQRQDAVEQDAGFSVNGVIIGSLGRDGVLNINHLVTSLEMEKSGVDKETGRELLALAEGQVNIAEVKSILENGFGDAAVKVEGFTLGQGPSYADAIRMIEEQQPRSVNIQA